MPLARIASTVQKTLLSHGRLAPAVTMGSGRDAFARFFGTGSLDRNAVTERVLASVKNFEKIDPNKVSTSSNFKDLGLDSLDTVEVVMALEEDFSVEIPDDEADAIQTVEQAVDYFVNHPHAT